MFLDTCVEMLVSFFQNSTQYKNLLYFLIICNVVLLKKFSKLQSQPLHTLTQILKLSLHSHQFSSVAQSGPTLCYPMDCSMPVFLVHHQLLDLAQTHVHRAYDAIHLILCRPLLFLSSIFPSIRVFSKESALCIRRPKYWSFSFSISPSNDYS